MAKISRKLQPGQTFGFLTVIGISQIKRAWSKEDYDCMCVCGSTTLASKRQLTRPMHGKHSCGCKSNEMRSVKATGHGLTEHRLYGIYHHMRERCYNPGNDAYANYGGRGIIMCDEWLSDFMNFYNWAMDNGYAENLQIDRINNNGNYEPANCRWTTQKVQMNNTRVNRIIEYNGQSKSSTEWAEHLKMSPKVMERRLNFLGWSVERALTKPVRKKSH